MPGKPPAPVLEYHAPEARDAVPSLAAMRRWRQVAGWGLVLAIAGVVTYPVLAAVGLVIFPPLTLAGLFIVCIGSIGALVCMVRAAAHEMGAGYAVRQLLLALLLLPVLFLGVFLITRLVEADLINWRLADQRKVRGPSPGSDSAPGGGR